MLMVIFFFFFLLLVSSSFGSVNVCVYIRGGKAGEEQEQHCHLVDSTTDLQVLPGDCFKGSVLYDLTELFDFPSVQLEI